MATNDPRLQQATQVHEYLRQLSHSPFNPPVSEIEPGLYIGGTPTPQFPQVDVVLNVSERVGAPEPEVSNKIDNTKPYAIFSMPVWDRAPFPGVAWLSVAVSIVEAAINAGWSILVHCDKGWSRSATVVIAYTMKRDGLSADDAIDKVLQKRAVSPNPWFLVGLQDWEQYLKQPQ